VAQAYLESLESCLEKVTTEELRRLAEVDAGARDLIESSAVAGEKAERLTRLLTKGCPLDVEPPNFWEEYTFRLSIEDGHVTLDAKRRPQG
jgi:hypothetical protein